MADPSTGHGLVTAAEVEDMRSWRHRLHRRPELGFALPATAGLVAEQLHSFDGIEVDEGVGSTGVVGILRRGSSSRAVGLRADMDALPIEEDATHGHRSSVEGAFHGCGHDGHTAMLLGAARHLAENGGFDGTIVFVFQPDEENGGGARAMIEDGLLDRFPVDAMYGMHNWPGIEAGTFATRVGPMMSSEDLFEITIVGRGGHASTPERHIDPVIVAAEIIQALQTIVSRSVAGTETAVVSVTEVVTDGARNIVPTTVTIRGDCRTFSPAVQRLVEDRMRTVVAGICQAHGAAGTVGYTNEFVPLVNTASEVDLAVRAAGRVAGPHRVDRNGPLITASEDFAQFLHRVPGCFVTIGNGLEGACGTSLHNPSYDFNDRILGTGADYWVTLARAALPPRTPGPAGPA